LTRILPLFPAQPKLGPVFHEVTQFVPGGFSRLSASMIPAAALDTLWARTGHWNRFLQSAVAGLVFLAATPRFVQWPFSSFLQSEWARNPTFGSHHPDHYSGPGSFMARYAFYPANNVLRESLLAIVISCGDHVSRVDRRGWMRRVRR
jgi:hypothetical protein